MPDLPKDQHPTGSENEKKLIGGFEGFKSAAPKTPRIEVTSPVAIEIGDTLYNWQDRLQ